VTSGQARRALRGDLVAFAVLSLGLPALLAAHSAWPSYYSSRTAVGIDGNGLQAVVVIEVPTFDLVADFRRHFADIDLVAEIEGGRFAALEDAYRESRFEDFAGDLELSIDGRQASGHWRPVDTPVNGRGTEGFFVYMLEFVLDEPLPARRRLTVRVLNRVLPEAQMVLANQAQAEDGWVVAESSIPEPTPVADLPPGAELLADAAMWSEDATKRDLRVTFAYDPPAGR